MLNLKSQTNIIKITDAADSMAAWQRDLANSVQDLQTLYRLVGLPECENSYRPKSFGLRVPKAFVDKIEKANPKDPLLLQILPQAQELNAAAGYTHDPLAENGQSPIKGLLHKYKSRALVTVTGACAVHCRYCFRQHFDYQANTPNHDDMAQILSYIRHDKSIDEVLLSGGDPLSLSHRRLTAWLTALDALPNIHTIRIHTRTPVVLPSRIDEPLIELIAGLSKHIVMVLHINHANEIDETLKVQLAQLKRVGVTLLSQTVLLKDINDDADVLAKLSHTAFDAGVLPYYLHILDKVVGAAHFDVPIERAVELYWQLLERLPGYLVPKLVQELPNKPHKMPVDVYQFNR
ncbi:EF-P beta-lysylation protein EpmB [Moraxella nasovis]|uniref:EF-P beta-lysylation protein EpmB n=1 Tax=Moraxella nasovis TaxID=2904121 RepID=UPI001F60E29D|nr:EF-P beta-lysylation protein EpmB [Moraxella nasovis]UNU72822.1 EF-P beta-lysylation protein EpmB [Moraxella nasovis]